MTFLRRTSPSVPRCWYWMVAIALSPTLAQAQHVHGQASLSLAIEGRTGTAELRAPADDVYGFEHAPRTAAERATQAAAFAKLRGGGGTLVRFVPTLGCTLSAQEVSATPDRNGHAEVRARYAIACRQAPAGAPITFGISATFPGIDRVAVQLLSDTAQVGATIARDRGKVTP